MADLANGFGDLGGAVSSIFGGIGDLSEASAYGTAAKYAGQNAELAKETTAIQAFQAQRKIGQVEGGQQAEVASAGFTNSGSSADLLRSSVAQGSLTKNLISIQGKVNENGYLEAQSQYQGMQANAEAAGAGGIFGGILKGVGALLAFA
jgi:hypothetical protein